MSFSLSLLAFFEEVGESFDPNCCDDACRVDIHQNGHDELNEPAHVRIPTKHFRPVWRGLFGRVH